MYEYFKTMYEYCEKSKGKVKKLVKGSSNKIHVIKVIFFLLSSLLRKLRKTTVEFTVQYNTSFIFSSS